MADWMNQLANAVDEAEAANALPQEEVPTEPATSPRHRMIEVPVNDGRWTTKEHAELLWYIAQDLNERDQAILQALLDRQHVDARTQKIHDMEKERRRAEAAEHEAHQRSIAEWEAKLQAQELDNAALPSGPTPQGTSSMRVLPDVHEVLRQNAPRVTSFSQPVVKKAPPTLDRARPAVFYSGKEPPRIGSGVPPPPPAAPRPAVVPSVELPLAATPMTPSHPPRPPLSALPKYSSMETSSGANKHPLEPPTASPDMGTLRLLTQVPAFASTNTPSGCPGDCTGSGGDSPTNPGAGQPRTPGQAGQRPIDPWAPLDRTRKSLPPFKLLPPIVPVACSTRGSYSKIDSISPPLPLHLERGMLHDIGRNKLWRLLEHATINGCQSSLGQRASLEPACMLGDRKLIPESVNAVETVLRAELWTPCRNPWLMHACVMAIALQSSSFGTS